MGQNRQRQSKEASMGGRETEGRPIAAVGETGAEETLEKPGGRTCNGSGIGRD
jgi:hypothetical protein